MEMKLNGVKIKNQVIQTDMLRQASNMLKVTACLDDTAAQKINDIVFQLEGLADALEEEIGKDMPFPKAPPILTVI